MIARSLAFMAAVLLVVPARAADRYSIDPEISMPAFSVGHLGVTTQRGTFKRVSGTVTLDRVAHTGSIEFRIDTTSLDMGTPAWTAHLAGTELFNTKNFPSMTFTSTQLAFEGDQVTGADGVLTMLGVTKPVHLDVSRFKCALHPQSQRPFCGCDVSATIRRSDFGLGKYLATVNDEVHIEAPVIAYRD